MYIRGQRVYFVCLLSYCLMLLSFDFRCNDVGVRSHCKSLYGCQCSVLTYNYTLNLHLQPKKKKKTTRHWTTNCVYEYRVYSFAKHLNVYEQKKNNCKSIQLTVQHEEKKKNTNRPLFLYCYFYFNHISFVCEYIRVGSVFCFFFSFRWTLCSIHTLFYIFICVCITFVFFLTVIHAYCLRVLYSTCIVWCTVLVELYRIFEKQKEMNEPDCAVFLIFFLCLSFISFGWRNSDERKKKKERNSWTHFLFGARLAHSENKSEMQKRKTKTNWAVTSHKRKAFCCKFIFRLELQINK